MARLQKCFLGDPDFRDASSVNLDLDHPSSPNTKKRRHHAPDHAYATVHILLLLNSAGGHDDHPRPFRTFSRKDLGTPTDATIAAAIPATAALAPQRPRGAAD